LAFGTAISSLLERMKKRLPPVLQTVPNICNKIDLKSDDATIDQRKNNRKENEPPFKKIIQFSTLTIPISNETRLETL
jgi:hypothetical protein